MKWTMDRMNPLGLNYRLTQLEDKQTTLIQLLGADKQIEVKHPLDTISKAWFKWQMEHDYIQSAFRFLNAEEREFLMTGILPAEWDALFKEDEK